MSLEAPRYPTTRRLLSTRPVIKQQTKTCSDLRPIKSSSVYSSYIITEKEAASVLAVGFAIMILKQESEGVDYRVTAYIIYYRDYY